MKDESFQKNEESFDRKLDEMISEADALILEVHHETYNYLIKEGVDYLNVPNNENVLCLTYEALIHFMLNEEYEKCLFIKKLLESFSDIRIRRICKKQKKYMI
jgi:hypothetical protein